VRWAKPERRAIKAIFRGGFTNPEHWRLLRESRRKKREEELKIEEYRRVLQGRREKGDIFAEKEPLVSVRIATYNRGRILAERTLPSVLAQTYSRFEVVVVGDCCSDDTEERIRALADPRISFINLPARPAYPKYREYFWMTAGSIPMNRALDLCRGSWIAPLDDDDEFTPDHIDKLLAACLANRWELAYGVMQMELSPGVFRRIGSHPLRGAHVCHPAVFYSSALNFLRYDPESWLLWEPADWDMLRKFRDMGARYGFLDEVVGVHYLEKTSVRP
jgi:glycosyltransferase involved in cell wall biosynthesis